MNNKILHDWWQQHEKPDTWWVEREICVVRCAIRDMRGIGRDVDICVMGVVRNTRGNGWFEIYIMWSVISVMRGMVRDSWRYC